MIDDWSDSVKRDFCRLFLGDMIGAGMSRNVYAHPHDPTLVIKVEDHAGKFQNVLEWQTWEDLKDTPAAKWLAPCRHISPGGTVLVMERTTPIRVGERPATMPAWLTDFKATNYGLLGKRVVCHDYGTNLLINHAGFSKRMRKVEWRDG